MKLKRTAAVGFVKIFNETNFYKDKYIIYFHQCFPYVFRGLLLKQNTSYLIFTVLDKKKNYYLKKAKLLKMFSEVASSHYPLPIHT